MTLLQSFDITIIGAGLVGQVLAIGLDRLGYQVALIESKNLKPLEPNEDLRAIALSYGSVECLKSLSLWACLSSFATPIHRVHVSEQGGFSQCRIKKEDLKLNYLGQVLEITNLLNNFLQELLLNTRVKIFASNKTKNFDFESKIFTLENGEFFKTSWVISAEGALSETAQRLEIKTQQKFFNQVAIVGNILLRESHENLAYERFTPAGPLALLPVSQNKATFIWAVTPEQAQELLAQSDSEFLKNLQKAFGYRAGKFEKLFKRQSHVLTQSQASENFKNGILLMGNAAHSLHPIAGQGFNLSLRDIQEFLKQVKNVGLKGPMAFDQYLKNRAQDQKEIAKFSESLVHLFTRPGCFPKLFRGLGLHVLERQAGLKKYLAERLAGIL